MAKKTNAGRKKVVMAFLLLFAPAFFLVFFSTRSCSNNFKELDDFGLAKDYSFIDINGEKRTSKDFEGDIVLITTLQGTCPDDCAVLFFNLQQAIYQHIYTNKGKKLKQVRIISFATDGEGNPLEDVTPIAEMLKDRVPNYDPETWVLAKGDARIVYNFERNNQNLLQEGDEFYGGQAFQELILLLDKKNHLRMALRGDEEGMIRRMKEHVALLQKQYDKERAKK
ncbi:MAG: SCO family protein [Flavobacteriales bacterium]|jgi:cytochrome oxidase Cu insertion factor (SCO1/SenC/PrrC family)